MRHHLQPRSVLLAVVTATALLVLAAAPAGAQATTSDPYGPTVPPTEPPGDPTCSIDGTGATVTGSIAGLEAGAEVDLTVLGEVVATVVADASGQADFTFATPAVAGVAAVVAVGVTFNVDCGEVGDEDVLGEGTDRPGESAGEDPGTAVAGGGASRDGGSGAAGTGSGTGSDAGSGPLARTGTVLAPLVALALVALAVGAYLRRRARGHTRIAM